MIQMFKIFDETNSSIPHLNQRQGTNSTIANDSPNKSSKPNMETPGPGSNGENPIVCHHNFSAKLP